MSILSLARPVKAKLVLVADNGLIRNTLEVDYDPENPEPAIKEILKDGPRMIKQLTDQLDNL